MNGLKKIVYMLCAAILLLAQPGLVLAKDDKEPRVLIIYSAEGCKTVSPQTRIMDSLTGHFSAKTDLISDCDLSKIDFRSYTHLIYMGLEKKQLPAGFIKQLNDFSGPALWMGQNIEQGGKRYAFAKTEGETLIESATMTASGASFQFAEERLAISIGKTTANLVLLEGRNAKGEDVPLLVKKGQSYYLGLESLFNPAGYFLGEALFDFFDRQPGRTYKSLRLEDVHPKTDPDNLREIADYLKEQKVPYMITLIPVYVDPKTHTETHLSDSPKLVKVLREMQKSGASIVLHGYRHQYKQEETGEGFEFWDVEHDRPVMQDQDEKALKEKDFSSRADFDKHVKKGTAFEKKYIKNAMERGIQELTAHKLYPLAFEAPHYAMSEQGYELLAEHFSTYVGQTQLTNETWQSQFSPLYTSKPEFLRGMKVIPETIGYVSADDPKSIRGMLDKADTLAKFSDGHIAGFYHPYLGPEKLKQLVAGLQQIPKAEWLDLKQFDNQVSYGDVTIKSTAGKVDVKKKRISSEYEKKLMIRSYMPWAGGMIVVVAGVIYWWFERKKQE